MSDLGTALRNALERQKLNENIRGWHDEEELRLHPQVHQTQEPPKPVSLTEMIFNYIRDNPGKTNAEVTQHFVDKGYKKTSVSSLAAQLVNAKMAKKDTQERITMVVDTYTPPRDPRKARREDYRRRAVKRLATMAAKKQEVKTPPTAPGIAALQVQATQPMLTALTPAQIVDMLSVRQARELYAALKEFFG